MSKEDEQLQAILEHNTGFDEPAIWIDYARSHDFKRVAATKVPRCPDCSGAPRSRLWGQQVYYSTLIRLLECEKCGLVWADAHLNSNTIRQHFEVAYKKDEYFLESRNAIFEHLATVIDSLAPRNARILDIGGARGHLMAKVVARRPDLSVTVNDISKAATDWAAEHFRLATLTGDANELASHSEQYDVVVLSDVLYYEPNLPVLWSALSRLIRRGGAVLIRVPNKALLIRLGQFWFRLTHARMSRVLQARIPFHNPEHIFVFRRRYLSNRLMSIGFRRIRDVPSPLLTNARSPALYSALFKFASIASRLSRHTLVLTPGTLVVGSCRDPEAAGVGDLEGAESAPPIGKERYR